MSAELLTRAQLAEAVGDNAAIISAFEKLFSTAYGLTGENVSLPVGWVYIQFPGDPDPTDMGLLGTWSDVSSELAGDFIRFAGGNASAFESGQQEDAVQEAQGTAGEIIVRGANQSALGVFSDSVFFGAGIITGGASADYMSPLDFKLSNSTSPNAMKTDDVETRSVNRTVLKWRRTA